ncbi:hypothetical protein ABH931_001508 [Streptacidiphilus sp. MAP12-33]|uniref:hypothetical protein n=1 Tax=Streptacidiphilus sp. MAP12-33 TaxID=3156266 RepID=UPI0035112770
MQNSRPAGGLSRRELIRARLGAWRLGALVRPGLFAAVVAFQIVGAEVKADWNPGPVYFVGAALALFYLLAWPFGRRSERRPRAQRFCPEAVAIARRAAEENGFPRPSAVAIVPQPVIRLGIHWFPRRTVVVQVGLPLLVSLSADELRVVLAHALAVTGEPHPAAAFEVLHKRRQFRAVPELIAAGRTARLLSRASVFLRRTDAFATEIEDRADQAAVVSAGSRQSAAAALLAAGRTLMSFDEFVSGYHRLVRRHRRIPEHLYSGWLEAREEGYALPADRRAFVATIARELRDVHPSLAGEFGDLAEQQPTATAAVVPVLAVVPPDLDRVMARAYGGRLIPANSTPRARAWRDIDPAQVFGPPPATSGMHEAASTVLGRPATAADVLDLLSTADGRQEVTRVILADSDERIVGDLEQALRPGVAASNAVLHELLTYGYRRLDVLHQMRVTAPDGSVLDVATATADALRSPEARQDLQALLADAAARSRAAAPIADAPA